MVPHSASKTVQVRREPTLLIHNAMRSERSMRYG
nr:MAG TPA: hypothetical protein [Caudoviricetes sp.]